MSHWRKHFERLCLLHRPDWKFSLPPVLLAEYHSFELKDAPEFARLPISERNEDKASEPVVAV